MRDYKKYTINRNEALVIALKKLNKLTHKILIVIDDQNKLCGTISDGDLRRWFINSYLVNYTCKDIMNSNCIYAEKNNLKDKICLAKKKGITLIPEVDDKKHLIDMHEVFIKITEKKTNTIVIMAGGRGSRLLPLTKSIPKPMIKVGGKPILARIIEKVIQEGFENIIISVGYLSNIIENFIKDSNFEANISFIHEDKPLGTAGCLGYLNKFTINYPIIVTNGDILCECNFQSIIDKAEQEGYEGMMLGKEEKIFMPFGVINNENGRWKGLIEKPTYTYLINAGIYLISKKMIKLIKKSEYLDMNSLFERSLENNIKLGVEDTTQYWIDIGRHESLRLADNYFRE